MARNAKSNDEDKDGARQEWATPAVPFDVWHSEFLFTVDACASAENAKLPRYWSKDMDGLIQRWEGERVWCNPPYNDIETWMARGFLAALRDPSSFSVFLVPPRPGQAWWHKYALRSQVDFFRGRIAFDIPESVRQRLLAEAAQARAAGDEKAAKALTQQAKGVQNDSDSVLVIVDGHRGAAGFVNVCEDAGSRTMTGGSLPFRTRSAHTGKLIALEAYDLPLGLPREAPAHLQTFDHEAPCRLCHEVRPDTPRRWSALCQSSVHINCLDAAIKVLEEMPRENRQQAEALLRAPVAP